MGYTHYFGVNKELYSAKTEKQYQLAIRQCNKIVRHYYSHFKGTDKSLSGYTAHCKNGLYLGLKINGVKSNSCEDFIMRDHFNNNESDFCKTRQHYYDIVVVACLITLKHYLDNAFSVESDGYRSNWFDGLNLAKAVLKLDTLEIPNTVPYDQLRIVK